MKVLVTGGTGFVGKKVVHALLQDKHEVWVLSRSKEKVHQEFSGAAKSIVWNGERLAESIDLEQIDAVINLMGENISSKRWNENQKIIILDSRVRGTKILLDYFSNRTKPLSVFVSASAIGVYKNSTGDEILDEQTKLGSGFLSEVCQSWEKVVNDNHSEKILRKVVVRIGVVLGREGGALEKLLPIFKLGGGGPIGNGEQWMSWIHVDDLVQLLVAAVKENKFQGKYNAVAPEAVTNLVFSKTLAKVLRRPCLFPVPAFMMKLIMGEMSCIVLDSQRIKPSKTLEAGYKFKFPDLSSALKDITLK
jgi:uncharacterized protein (TIGR01777 family)